MPRLISSADFKRSRKLRDKQVDLLRVLSRATGPLDLETLCERAGKAHPTYIIMKSLGSSNPKTREIREKRNGYPTLLTLGYVKFTKITVEEQSITIYEITNEGRQAFEDYLDNLDR